MDYPIRKMFWLTEEGGAHVILRDGTKVWQPMRDDSDDLLVAYSFRLDGVWHMVWHMDPCIVKDRALVNLDKKIARLEGHGKCLTGSDIIVFLEKSDEGTRRLLRADTMSDLPSATEPLGEDLEKQVVMGLEDVKHGRIAKREGRFSDSLTDDELDELYKY